MTLIDFPLGCTAVVTGSLAIVLDTHGRLVDVALLHDGRAYRITEAQQRQQADKLTRVRALKAANVAKRRAARVTREAAAPARHQRAA